MEKIIYRYANLDDLNQLIELRGLMQSEVNDLSSLHIDPLYQESVKNYFLTNLPSENYMSALAVTSSGLIVGTAGVCFYQKPPSISGGSGLVGYVTNVYTRVSYRCRGVGGELMKLLNELAKIKNADKLHLGATSDGMSIYTKVGYKEPRFISLEMKF